MKRYKIVQISYFKQFYNVVKINIQIFALRREFLCICKANTESDYIVCVYYNIDCFSQKLRICEINVEINIQIHALRHEFLCICKANTDDGYAVYIYYNIYKFVFQ